MTRAQHPAPFERRRQEELAVNAAQAIDDLEDGTIDAPAPVVAALGADVPEPTAPEPEADAPKPAAKKVAGAKHPAKKAAR